MKVKTVFLLLLWGLSLTLSAESAINPHYVSSPKHHAQHTSSEEPLISFDVSEKVAYRLGDALSLPTLSNPQSLDILYDSSDPAVATISATGEVKVIATGTTFITATAVDVEGTALASASYELEVTDPNTSPFTVSYGPEHGVFYRYGETIITTGYASKWVSNATEPQVTISVGKLDDGVNQLMNNMDAATGAIYPGSRSTFCTYYLTAQEGYIITGYTITGTAQEADQVLEPSENGTATTFTTDGLTTLAVRGLNSSEASFVHYLPNKGIAITSFTIHLAVNHEALSEISTRYESAMASLEDGEQYWISTLLTDEVTGERQRLFLKNDGYLTSDYFSASVFTLDNVSAEKTFCASGWKARDVAFTSPELNYNYYGTISHTGHLATDTENNRNDWEAQVYLKEGDFYAIRCTNVNTTAYWANAYWSTMQDDDDATVADYAEEPCYIWQVEPFSAAKDASLRLARQLPTYQSHSFDLCDAALLATYQSLLEEAVTLANPDFEATSHDARCITLLPELESAYETVRSSERAYKNYVAMHEEILEIIDGLEEHGTPLEAELKQIENPLSEQLAARCVSSTDFNAAYGQAVDAIVYWANHIDPAELVILRDFLAEIGTEGAWDARWDLEAEPLRLDGVTQSGGSVIAIDLSGRDLACGFPASLLRLSHLRSLNLSGCQLSGSISMGDGVPATLTSLNLSNNDFTSLTDDLPASITTVNLHGQHSSEPVVVDLTTLSDEGILSQLPSLYTINARAKTEHYALRIFTSEDESEHMTLSNLSGTPTLSFSDHFVYRRASGETLKCRTTYGDALGSELPAVFRFAQGDTSLDGEVDIADLQTMIGFIFGELDSRQGFNFTAADLYEDGSINVQDIIREVDLLLSQATPAAGAPRRLLTQNVETAEPEATLSAAGNEIRLSSECAVAALDLSILTDADLDLTPLQALGFTISTRRQGSVLRLIAYSLAGAEIPAGDQLLFSCNAGTASVLSAKLTDSKARRIVATIGEGTTTAVRTASEICGQWYLYDAAGRLLERGEGRASLREALSRNAATPCLLHHQTAAGRWETAKIHTTK